MFILDGGLLVRNNIKRVTLVSNKIELLEKFNDCATGSYINNKSILCSRLRDISNVIHFYLVFSFIPNHLSLSSKKFPIKQKKVHLSKIAPFFQTKTNKK